MPGGGAGCRGVWRLQCSVLLRTVPVVSFLAHGQVVDERLLQFKKEQRDNRNKAKLEYIIGAALEGPQALDETLLDLCETRGLDDGLVDYLDEIVEKARNADLSADAAKSAVCAPLNP